MCLWQMKLCKASSIEERAEGGKLCRRSASRKMNLLTAHCVVSSVRVQRRVRFPSSVSVSIMKARASSAARSLRLHALRRRSSAKIEFQRADALHLLFFCKVQGDAVPPGYVSGSEETGNDTAPARQGRPRHRGSGIKSPAKLDFYGEFLHAAHCGAPALSVSALPECGRRGELFTEQTWSVYGFFKILSYFRHEKPVS